MSSALKTPTFRRGRPSRLVRFLADRRAVSAVEFAMLLPLMLTLYLGAVEVSQAVSVSRKATLTASTVADLTAQVSSINNSAMSDILSASSAVIQPYDATQLTVTVTSITIDANSRATVAWSDSLKGTAHPVGSTVTLPTGLVVPNTSVIWGETTYSYRPTIGYVITGTLNLYEQTYEQPRVSATVTRVNS
jgi:Flp pilus assembly protein TadG